jgi:PIN domain nuclease of toxin-antitoxin system
MAGVVLDASAMLALVLREPGAERVQRDLARSVASAVNWLEVVQRLRIRGAALAGTRADFVEAGLTFAPLSAERAERAARLRDVTRAFGLSLADRCCLALAAETGRIALTADAAWTSVDAGVEVELIR